MIGKFKQIMESRAMFSKVSVANDKNIIKPFLLGCQMEYRRFDNYIFTKNNTANVSLLKERHFGDFKETIGKKINWELEDTISKFGDAVMYNEKYNIMIVMVSEKVWEILNTAINIAEKTQKDVDTQRDIVISAFQTLKV